MMTLSINGFDTRLGVGHVDATNNNQKKINLMAGISCMTQASRARGRRRSCQSWFSGTLIRRIVPAD